MPAVVDRKNDEHITEDDVWGKVSGATPAVGAGPWVL